ncbi:YqzL family protein [Anaerophilus nitritogenes]|nr:YqzL family protein [Anaerophilus nitritogenes]
MMLATSEWFWKVFLLTGNIHAYLGYKQMISNH